MLHRTNAFRLWTLRREHSLSSPIEARKRGLKRNCWFLAEARKTSAASSDQGSSAIIICSTMTDLRTSIRGVPLHQSRDNGTSRHPPIRPIHRRNSYDPNISPNRALHGRRLRLFHQIGRASCRERDAIAEV